ncbi:MAG: M15 family metallopeptidase [Lachnospiraceae bacterium]|nr:M15 family metallopeptidase [Lachnospiraceae bacterium]
MTKKVNQIDMIQLEMRHQADDRVRKSTALRNERSPSQRKNSKENTYHRKIRRHRRRKQKIKKLICSVAVIMVLLVMGKWGVHSFLKGSQPEGKESGAVTVDKEIKEKLIPSEENGDNKEITNQEEAKNVLTQEDIQEAIRIYQANPELLVLVNKNCELSKDYNANLRNICNKRLKASDRLYKDLARMLEDGSDQGHNFWIASAYRSRQRQQALVNEDVRKFKKQGMSEEEALAKTLEETMPAGHSEHETGLALDILDSMNMKMDQTQENYKGNQWLREHCHEYGFVLRYPKEKEEITMISYEPWHLRYVGMEAAAFMKAHNLTLEEFHQAIQTAAPEQ